MKQLFIGLVLLNLGYLLFQQMTTADVVAIEARPETVALEAPPSTSVALARPKPLPDALPEGASRTESTVAQSYVPSPSTPITSTPAEAPVVLEEDPEESAASPQAEVAVQPDAKPVAEPEIASESSVPPADCVISGPYSTQQAAQALVNQLADAGIDAELQSRDVALLPDYMVYVGPADSLAEARDLEAVFKARKMESHIITAGTLRNALSLGVFSRGVLAQSLLRQLQEEGYKAKISELVRNRRGYQVRAQLPPLMRARLVAADMPLIDCPRTIAQDKSIL